MVTDKVYDRAMPIDINEKGVPFEPVDTDPLDVNFSYLNGLFETAMEEYAMSPATLKKSLLEEKSYFLIFLFLLHHFLQLDMI